jgi:hypothetical protein
VRVVGEGEREPQGSVSYSVIIEDLTAVRDQVIELEAEGEQIPGEAGATMRTSLLQLRLLVESIIGLAHLERARLGTETEPADE